MKILLTGATGFIGSYIADELFLKGYELMLIKRSGFNLKIDDFCNEFGYPN